MLTCIRGGRVIDPAQRRDAVGDVWIHDDRIVQPPAAGAPADAVPEGSGMVVMAGAIDIHSHIAGANVNTARLLLPEWRRGAAPRSELTPLSSAGWTTRQTGRDYAAMGFTTAVEPAIAPHQALHAHLELADVPIIDKAILCVLGNDDAMFRDAAFVFKDGDLVVRDGRILHHRSGRALSIDRKIDHATERRMRDYYQETYGLEPDLLKVRASALAVADPFEAVSC